MNRYRGTEIAAAVAAGPLARHAMWWRTCLDRIERLNPVLNAFTAVTAERARAKAAAVDARRGQRDRWRACRSR